nr:MULTISPECIES: hypothetical protein [Pseudomonas]
MMLAFDFIEGIAHRVEKVLVGRKNAAIERELDDGSGFGQRGRELEAITEYIAQYGSLPIVGSRMEPADIQLGASPAGAVIVALQGQHILRVRSRSEAFQFGFIQFANAKQIENAFSQQLFTGEAHQAAQCIAYRDDPALTVELDRRALHFQKLHGLLQLLEIVSQFRQIMLQMSIEHARS